MSKETETEKTVVGPEIGNENQEEETDDEE